MGARIVSLGQVEQTIAVVYVVLSVIAIVRQPWRKSWQGTKRAWCERS